MEKQISLTSFTELSSSDLTQIWGGNWWLNFIRNLLPSCLREFRNYNHIKI